jgi:topoisomerase-4 subunit A
MGSAQTPILLASNAGFGFIGRLGDMVTKNKAGKAVLSVPAGGAALMPCVIDAEQIASSAVAAVTDQGRMLVFPLSELPELARGKGNKLINVPTAAFKSGEETMISVVVITEDQDLIVHAGQRHLRMKRKDLENYIGERARRGRKLPRGFQKVDRLSVE